MMRELTLVLCCLSAAVALAEPPAEIKPWYGPMRGFAYAREVQPVIDRHCVGCHNGQPQPDGGQIADLRGTERISDYRIHGMASMGGRFSVGYSELHRFVRRDDRHHLAGAGADRSQIGQSD